MFSGTLRLGDDVRISKLDGRRSATRMTKLYSFEGLKRVEGTTRRPGDIVAIAGVEGITIGETVDAPSTPRRCPTSRSTSRPSR